jgi:hypothetical protein
MTCSGGNLGRCSTATRPATLDTSAPSAVEPQEPRGSDYGGAPLGSGASRRASRPGRPERASRWVPLGPVSGGKGRRGRIQRLRVRVDGRTPCPDLTQWPRPTPGRGASIGGPVLVSLTAPAPPSLTWFQHLRALGGRRDFGVVHLYNICTTPSWGSLFLTALSRGNWRAAHRQVEIRGWQMEGSRPASGG